MIGTLTPEGNIPELPYKNNDNYMYLPKFNSLEFLERDKKVG